VLGQYSLSLLDDRRQISILPRPRGGCSSERTRRRLPLCAFAKRPAVKVVRSHGPRCLEPVLVAPSDLDCLAFGGLCTDGQGRLSLCDDDTPECHPSLGPGGTGSIGDS
jgi:hypothetical protein